MPPKTVRMDAVVNLYINANTDTHVHASSNTDNEVNASKPKVPNRQRSSSMRIACAGSQTTMCPCKQAHVRAVVEAPDARCPIV
eukprot:5452730-Pleurochrysis_carterae.AAC.2